MARNPQHGGRTLRPCGRERHECGFRSDSEYVQLCRIWNGDIIDTYIYRRTFQLGSDFGSSTAVGLFKSVINLALLLIANYGVKKMGENGII